MNPIDPKQPAQCRNEGNRIVVTLYGVRIFNTRHHNQALSLADDINAALRLHASQPGESRAAAEPQPVK